MVVVRDGEKGAAREKVAARVAAKVAERVEVATEAVRAVARVGGATTWLAPHAARASVMLVSGAGEAGAAA